MAWASGAWSAAGSTAYTTDALGRTTDTVHKNAAGATVGGSNYSFDAGDRITGQTINGATQSFGYDSLDQVTNNNGAALTYDKSGNRTVSGYVVGAGNRVTSDGTWSYTYDDTGAVTGKSKSGEAWAYTYDLNGQMTSASKSATAGGAVTDSVVYTYDAWGNRVSRVQTGTTSSTERYVVDGWDTAKGGAVGTENFDVTLDLNGSNAVTGRRLFGAGFDAAVARRDAGGAVSWYGADGLGSVRQVFDNSGSVTGSRTFDGFGNVTAASGTGLDRYGYTGTVTDPLTGLVGDNARVYDPTTGRWYSPDPDGFAAGDANLYRYVGNNATGATDPSGMQPPQPVKGFVGDMNFGGGPNRRLPAPPTVPSASAYKPIPVPVYARGTGSLLTPESALELAGYVGGYGPVSIEWAKLIPFETELDLVRKYETAAKKDRAFNNLPIHKFVSTDIESGESIISYSKAAVDLAGPEVGSAQYQRDQEFLESRFAVGEILAKYPRPKNVRTAAPWMYDVPFAGHAACANDAIENGDAGLFIYHAFAAAFDLQAVISLPQFAWSVGKLGVSGVRYALGKSGQSGLNASISAHAERQAGTTLGRGSAPGAVYPPGSTSPWYRPGSTSPWTPPPLRPSHFGLSTIAEDPALHRMWTDALRSASTSRRPNGYTRYLEALEQGRTPSAEMLEEAFGAVNKRFMESARAARHDIAEVHHWNYNKATFADQIVDPRHLVPTPTRAVHESIHRWTTSDPTNIWRGPTDPRHVLPVPGAGTTPLPPGPR